MLNSWTDRRWNPLVALVVLMIIWACGDDGGGCDDFDLGCDGCGDGDGGSEEAYSFPVDGPVVQQGVQLRVTRSGFAFIEENFDTIVGLLLDDEGEGEGIKFCLENQSIDLLGFPLAAICPNPGTCSDGGTGCDVEIILEELSITPRNPRNVNRETGRLEVELTISTSAIPWRLVAGTCRARVENLPIKAVVTFNVDGTFTLERTHINIPSNELEFELRTQYLNLNAGPDLGCGIVGGLVGFFVNLLSGVIADLIVDPVTEAVEGFTCVTCRLPSDCPENYRCDKDGGDVNDPSEQGICRLPGNEECLQADLGLETQFDVGGLLGDIAPGLEARLGIMAYLANYADTRDGGGLDLAAQIGFESDPNLCVPLRSPPSVTPVAKSDVLHGETIPGTSPAQEFAVGVGLSGRALDLALWAAYNSGVLCLSIGADTAEQLTTSLFSLLLSSLNEVTNRRNLPLLIQLAPQQAPYVTIGDGTINRDGTRPTIDDPLLNITIPDLDLHFYTWLHDRWVRLFALNVDVDLPLGLDVDEDANAIVPIIGDLSNALSRIEPRDGELLRQSDLDQLADLLPGLISSVAGPLTDGLTDGFELPELAGFELILTPDSFTGVGDPANRLLAIFAGIGLATNSMRMPHETILRHVNIDVPSAASIQTAAERARARGQTVPASAFQPVVRMQAEALRSDGVAFDDAEFSWRIGGGLWSLWTPGPALEIRDPRLRIEGRHTLEVRSRPAAAVGGQGRHTAAIEVLVDWAPPEIEADALDGRVSVRAQDNLHREDELEMRFATDDHAWSPWGPVDDFVVRSDARQVMVEVRDPSGNTGRLETSMKRSEAGQAASGEPPTASTSPRAGCSAAPGSGGGWTLFLVLGLLFVGRKRVLRRVALLAAAALLIGCSSSGSTSIEGDCDEDRPCEDGFDCVEGVCVEAEPVDRCETTADCDDGLVCLDGECVALACEDDAGVCDGVSCPDGLEPFCGPEGCYCGGCPDACNDTQFCCALRGRCEALPDVCADTTCPPGQRPEPQRDATMNSGTCEADDAGACTCVVLDPLPFGQYGTFMDAAVSPDGAFIAVSARNQTYQDLLFGYFDGGSEIAWTFVDGVPSGAPVTGDIAGPRGGIEDTGDDVGEHNAIAVGPDGAVHVVYAVVGGGERRAWLRYARGEGTGAERAWSFLELDETSFTGRYPHVFMDPDGRPVVLYSAVRFRDDDSEVWFSELRLAHATSTDPAGPEDWTRLVLDRVEHDEPCGGRCPGSNDVCRLDGQRCEVPQRRGCSPACEDGEACFLNDDVFACAPVAGSPPYQTPIRATGMFPSAAWRGDGSLVVTWYDGLNSNLKFMEIPPDAEELPPVRLIDEDYAADFDIGRFARVFVDSTDTVYVAYVDASMAELRVFNITDETIMTVDDGIYTEDDPGSTGFSISRVGEDPYLVEVSGRLVITYQDTTKHALLESRLEFDQDNNPGWTPRSVVEGRFLGDAYQGAQGFHARHLRTSFGRFVVHHRMNLRATPVVRDVVVSPL